MKNSSWLSSRVNNLLIIFLRFRPNAYTSVSRPCFSLLQTKHEVFTGVCIASMFDSKFSTFWFLSSVTSNCPLPCFSGRVLLHSRCQFVYKDILERKSFVFAFSDMKFFACKHSIYPGFFISGY